MEGVYLTFTTSGKIRKKACQIWFMLYLDPGMLSD